MPKNYNIKKITISFLVSVCILIVGFFLNHNKITFCILATTLFAIDINEHVFKYKVTGIRKISIVSMLLLLLANLAYSFFLDYHAPLDGDIPGIMTFQPAMYDPFGLEVLLHNKFYSCPNRAVLEWCFTAYIKNMPLFFQSISSPVNSIYLSCACAKILMQAGYIYLFGVIISGQYRIFNRQFLFAAILIMPLIQICGYVWAMGIIDPSITFAFAYGFSILLVCMFFLPFFMSSYYQRPLNFNYFTLTLMILLSLFNAFNGPLNAPVTLLIGSFILLNDWLKSMKQNKQLSFTYRNIAFIKQAPKYSVFIIAFSMLVAVYSYYIGKNNSMNLDRTIPLIDRYKVLPDAILGMIKQQGPLMILSMIMVNVIIINRQKFNLLSQKITRLLLWLVLFSVCYISLLPFGGYRYYRPKIVGIDTILPVTVSLIAFYGLSTYYILKSIVPGYKKIYSGATMILLLYLVVASTHNRFDNTCEKESLTQISESKDKIILLNNDCLIMSWSKITDYKDSKQNMELLKYWGVIHEEKYFYQK